MSGSRTGRGILCLHGNRRLDSGMCCGGGGSAGVERREGKRGGLIFVFPFLDLGQGLRAAVLHQGVGRRRGQWPCRDGRLAGGGGGRRGEDAGRLLLLVPPLQRHVQGSIISAAN